MLIAATLLTIKNSAWPELYISLLNISGQMKIECLNREVPLFIWLNDRSTA